MANINLVNLMSPGDVVVFATLIKDIYDCLNEKINVLTYYPEILYNSPYINNNCDAKNISINQFLEKYSERRDPIIFGVDVDFMLEHRDIFLSRNYHGHYSNVLNYIFNKKMNDFAPNFLPYIPYNSFIPELFFTEEEKNPDIVKMKFNLDPGYWLFNAGIKQDMPLKSWPIFYWCQLISELKKRNFNLAQVGSHLHVHPEFRGIKSLIGKTENIRDFLVLCYHAEGIICHVSFPMHVFASLKKPAIVISGGRETVKYEQYDFHQYHHSIGAVDCCSEFGCWFKERSECLDMVGNPSYPKCMVLIKPEEILLSILKYREGKNERNE